MTGSVAVKQIRGETMEAEQGMENDGDVSRTLQLLAVLPGTPQTPELSF